MDQPTRGVTVASMQRWFWLWDAYIIVSFLVAMATTIGEASTTADQRLGAAGALTCLLAWYFLLGRRLVRAGNNGWPAVVFAVGVVVLFGVEAAFIPTNSVMLFGLYPMIFMAVPLRLALPLIVLVSLLPAGGLLLHGEPWEQLRHQVVSPLVGMVIAAIIGTWIVRTSDQSDEQAALIERLEASRAEVARLSHEAGTAAERARLAREIHDTLAQGFTSIVTLVQAVESELDSDRDNARKHLALAAQTARENLREARTMVAALTPAALDAGSLEDSVRRQVERLAEETDIQAGYRTVGEAEELPTAVEVVLLRAAQEALSNVRRHADARTVSVSLGFTDTAVTLSVVDDGAGFDPTIAGSGFGLRGMRARAEEVSGMLVIDSGPGRGTRLELEVLR